MSVTFNDRSSEVLSALDRAKRNALTAIGMTAVGHAKKVITDERRVDTGRMRNSISHAEDKDSTYIGSNVEYSIYNELGTIRMRGIHFLQRAATQHNEEYKKLAEEAMRNA